MESSHEANPVKAEPEAKSRSYSQVSAELAKAQKKHDENVQAMHKSANEMKALRVELEQLRDG